MTLTVIFANNWEQVCRSEFIGGAQGETRKRTVQIELTPEQARQLTPRKVGTGGGDRYEDIWAVFIEPGQEVT